MAKQKRSAEYYSKITKYESSPEQKARRAARGRARYDYEKEKGPIPKNMEVHHIEHSLKGKLDNSPNNLALLTRKQNMQEMNRKFNKGKKHEK